MHLAFLSRNPSGADLPGPRGGLLGHHEKELFSILLMMLPGRQGNRLRTSTGGSSFSPSPLSLPAIASPATR